MKILSAPRTGSLGAETYYQSPFGVCARRRTVPRDRPSNRKAAARSYFGISSREWGLKLSEAQRERWNAAALHVPSRPWMGQYSHLSGQQFCVQINSTLRGLGLAPVEEPPAPVVFGPNPVTGLEIVNDAQDGVRLRLNVGATHEDIMVFGQPPCSAGRMKPRRAYYLGLLGPSQNGQSDITDLYAARFGRPAPGQKVFIAVVQTRNGWKGQSWVHNAIVPPPPTLKSQQAAETATVKKSKPAAAPASTAAHKTVPSPSFQAMYKGSTSEARQEHTENKHEPPLSSLCTPVVHGLMGALGWLGRVGRVWARA